MQDTTTQSILMFKSATNILTKLITSPNGSVGSKKLKSINNYTEPDTPKLLPKLPTPKSDDQNYVRGRQLKNKSFDKLNK